jgi:hypothetical protein
MHQPEADMAWRAGKTTKTMRILRQLGIFIVVPMPSIVNHKCGRWFIVEHCRRAICRRRSVTVRRSPLSLLLHFARFKFSHHRPNTGGLNTHSQQDKAAELKRRAKDVVTNFVPHAQNPAFTPLYRRNLSVPR